MGSFDEDSEGRHSRCEVRLRRHAAPNRDSYRQGSNWPATKWFFDHLEAANVDYDIIGESFYPEWHHGTLEGIWNTMVQCANRYNKPFLVAETGYDSTEGEEQ